MDFTSQVQTSNKLHIDGIHLYTVPVLVVNRGHGSRARLTCQGSPWQKWAHIESHFLCTLCEVFPCWEPTCSQICSVVIWFNINEFGNVNKSERRGTAKGWQVGETLSSCKETLQSFRTLSHFFSLLFCLSGLMLVQLQFNLYVTYNHTVTEMCVFAVFGSRSCSV